MRKIVVSGGFDPLHPGHISMIESAAKLGELHIVLSSNERLIRKKGFYFQSWEDRKKMLEVYTPHVHAVDDADGTICEALSRLKPDVFGSGGDEDFVNSPELLLCSELGIETMFELGGGKYSSSSFINTKRKVETRWGSYEVLVDMPKLKVKMLHIDAGETLSLQRHAKRSEFFFMPNGEVKVNLPGVWHAPRAPEDQSLDILEVQVGISEEDDIERISETASDYEKECVKKIILNK